MELIELVAMFSVVILTLTKSEPPTVLLYLAMFTSQQKYSGVGQRCKYTLYYSRYTQNGQVCEQCSSIDVWHEAI